MADQLQVGNILLQIDNILLQVGSVGDMPMQVGSISLQFELQCESTSARIGLDPKISGMLMDVGWMGEGAWVQKCSK